MKLILINWKWLPISPITEDDEPIDLNPFVHQVQVANGGARLLQLNLQREEADFEDEYEEYYAPRNEMLKEIIDEQTQDAELLLFLHKNAPHYYSDYDVAWFKQHCPNIQVELFGGGEDFLYDLHNPSSGLLDQVGNFSPNALNESKQLKKAYFDGVWEHYCGLQSAISVDSYAFFRAIMEELLPVFEVAHPNAALVDKAKAFLADQEAIANLSPPVQQELQQLAAGQLPNVLVLREQLA
ncbi:MAG: hypothetical protein ACPGJS_03995 [Flammeovirgaceae bacterium]